MAAKHPAWVDALIVYGFTLSGLAIAGAFVGVGEAGRADVQALIDGMWDFLNLGLVFAPFFAGLVLGKTQAMTVPPLISQALWLNFAFILPILLLHVYRTGIGLEGLGILTVVVMASEAAAATGAAGGAWWSQQEDKGGRKRAPV